MKNRKREGSKEGFAGLSILILSILIDPDAPLLE